MTFGKQHYHDWCVTLRDKAGKTFYFPGMFKFSASASVCFSETVGGFGSESCNHITLDF